MFSQKLETGLKMEITPEETLIFENTQNCYYCDKIFEKPESQILFDCETLSEMGYEEPEDLLDFEADEYFVEPKKKRRPIHF
jgi:hypothetical protein